MVQPTEKAENQHYVPKMLLKYFCNLQSGNVHCFDKHTEKTFASNPKNLASERNFYVTDFTGDAVTIEPVLSLLEAKTATVIDTIISTQSLKNLSQDDLSILRFFVAIQHLRVKQQREAIKQVAETFKKRFKGMDDVTDEAIKDVMVKNLLNSAPELAFELTNKDCVLLKPLPGDTFYISDHPVVMHNEKPAGPFLGNLGYRVKGIQIYMPLTPTLCLGFWCKTVKIPIYTGVEKYKAFKDQFPQDLPIEHKQLQADLEKAVSQLQPIYDAIEGGYPMESSSANTRLLNSRQVMFSSRFIYSANDNFDLVQEMLVDDPRFKQGLSPQPRL